MPLIILHGSEHLQRKEAFDKLRAELDTDGGLATNTATLDARQSTPQEVMAACDTVPFLGDGRLVVLEGLLTTAGKGRRSKKKVESDEDAADVGPWVVLADYIPRMPQSTTLVLIDDEAPATGLLKDLGPLASKVESFRPVNEKALPQWVMERSKQVGLKIEPAAARLLAELIGSEETDNRYKSVSHMGMLAMEVDKLAAYANGEVVRDADVRELVGRAKEHKGYELTDAILDGQAARAAKILEEQIADNAVLPVLLSTIAGQYRRVAIVKDMLERGEPGTRISSRINVKMGFGLDKLIDRAQRHSWSALRQVYARIIQAELDLKQGLMTPGDSRENERLALEILVQELASRPARESVGAR